MSLKKKKFDPKRNHIFAAAIDELRRREGKKLSQKEIAKRMGVTEDTVSRIMRLRNYVTEDIISRLQTASGCIFNLQWLRGESDTMLVIDVDKPSTPMTENLHQSAPIDQSSLINATIAAQQTSIESLKRELASAYELAEKAEASAKRELAAKQETIDALRSELATKNTIITTLQQQVADLRKQQLSGALACYPFPMGVAEERDHIK